MISLSTIVKTLRQFRSLHRYTSVGLAIFILLTSVTGVLLGWKKNSVTLQPPTLKGVSTDMKVWRTFGEIATAALYGMDSIGHGGNVIDRMDVRPDKGIIKVIFKNGYWEAQVDGKSGKVLSLAQRHSDWIEHLHDGSIINDAFKFFYTNILGLGLFMLALTGLWLWYGPRVVRKLK